MIWSLDLFNLRLRNQASDRFRKYWKINLEYRHNVTKLTSLKRLILIYFIKNLFYIVHNMTGF